MQEHIFEEYTHLCVLALSDPGADWFIWMIFYCICHCGKLWLVPVAFYNVSFISVRWPSVTRIREKL